MPNKQSRKQRSKARPPRKQQQLVNAWSSGVRGPEMKFNNSHFSNQQLYHNVAAALNNTTNLLDNIVQGTGVTNRIGLSIMVKRLQLRLVFNTKGDRPNVSFRVAVTASPTTASSDTYTELFSGGWFAGVHLPTNSILLSDATFPHNQGSTMDNTAFLKERSHIHTLDLPIGHLVTYNTDQLCQTRLSVWLICYEQHSTMPTDNIASLAQASWRLDFTDP